MAIKTNEDKFKYLESYKWSSLPGFISKKREEEFVNYEAILQECGGVNAKGRKSYKKLLYYNMTKGLEIKKDILGQCILGGEEFIKWVKEEILNKKVDKECSQLIKLQK